MTTGEGGCIATRDAELAKKLVYYVFMALIATRGIVMAKAARKIMSVLPGFKYNMMDIQRCTRITSIKRIGWFY